MLPLIYVPLDCLTEVPLPSSGNSVCFGSEGYELIQEALGLLDFLDKQVDENSVTLTGGMGMQAHRGRANSTCSEEGIEATQEADYDGDGEDSIHYSSTENLHQAV